MTVDERQEVIQRLYERVLAAANELLHRAKSFKVEFLQTIDNPTYEELSEIMNKVCKVIMALCDDVDDPLTGIKASEYCLLVHKMAMAIKEGKQDELDQLVLQLDGRSFL